MKPEIIERIKTIKRGKVPNGYKKTRIGILPNDWSVKRLIDLTVGKGTYGVSAPAVEFNENLPRYLRITDIDEHGRITNNDIKCVDHPDASKYLLEENDVVFARTGNTTGKTYLYDKKDGELVYAGYLIRFKISQDKASAKYVKYYTESDQYWYWVRKMSARSGQPGINSEEYAELLLPCPEIPEQQKIADILSTWDKAIELKEKLIEQKKEQKKGLMQRLLTGKVRLPGFEGEWVKVEFGKVMKFPKKKPVDKPEDYYLLTVKLHLKGIEATNKKPNVTSKGRPYFLREPGELLIGRQNFHNGGIGIVPEGMTGYVASNAISSIVAIKGNIKFYYYYMSNKNFFKRVEHLIGGTGQKEISESMLKKLKLVIPPTEKEQDAIVEVLTLLDKEIELLDNELSNLKQQKKGLMQLLLTGKVRVKY